MLPARDKPANDPASAPARRDLAVIDIGSNSVRLVQFRLEGRAVWPVFNEKTMAGLGRGLRTSGSLHPEGVEAALRALRRFSSLLDAKGVIDRRAVATAAVRDAKDGAQFVRRAAKQARMEIQVIDGPEEGRLSTLGVLAGIGDGHGVAGDLGGSSVELTRLNGREVGPSVSLPLGPLSVFEGPPGDAREQKPLIEAGLDEAADLLKGSGPEFYAVGGAWRSFARLAMALYGHPLGLLHQYTLERDRVLRAADFASSLTEASIADTPGVSSKRAATLPYAAQLLKRIVKRGGFKRVVFSAYGLREGVVFSQDLNLLAKGDPLIEGAAALARPVSPEPGFGPALAAWIEPVFKPEPGWFSSGDDIRLRAAAARLADLGSRMHPDHRAELAAQQVLYAPFGGITHPQRAFLSLVVHHRYEGRKPALNSELCERLLSDEQAEAAMRLGLALRLGAALSGRSAGVLSAFRLKRSDERLMLHVQQGREELVVERARQRFEQLAAALGLKAQTA
ncbi:MAG: Ppx/GppA family phosphatase [Pseudomonadota bacterium]